MTHTSDASELLVRYAARHRDQRNIASHLVAQPLLVFSVFAALDRIVVGRLFGTRRR